MANKKSENKAETTRRNITLELDTAALYDELYKKGQAAFGKGKTGFTTNDLMKYLLTKANLNEYKVSTTDTVNAKGRKVEANGLRGQMKVESYILDAIHLGHDHAGNKIDKAITSGRLQRLLSVNSKIIKGVMEMYKEEIAQHNKQFGM